jgi:hypothetical protein
LLLEELPWMMHQLFLRLRLLPSKKKLMVSNCYRKKTRSVAPAVISAKYHRAASYWCGEFCFLTNYFEEEKVQGSFLKSLLTMLRSI